MFVTDDLIFIELHKTGSSHIAKLLSSITDGKQIGKHNPAQPKHFDGNHTFLSSIRNPWDWYLSLWSYGCGKMGSFYKRVASPKPRLTAHGWQKNLGHALQSLANEPFRNAEEWSDCYRDIEDAGRFRKWLHMVHSADYWADYGEGYSASAVNTVAGFYTYRYLQLCTRNPQELETHHSLTGKQLSRFDQTNCYIDHFIHTEHLEEDFIETMHKCGYELSDETKKMIRSSGRTNTSSGKRATGYYYDNETLQLIQDREQLIIDKFNYTPPSV